MLMLICLLATFVAYSQGQFLLRPPPPYIEIQQEITALSNTITLSSTTYQNTIRTASTTLINNVNAAKIQLDSSTAALVNLGSGASPICFIYINQAIMQMQQLSTEVMNYGQEDVNSANTNLMTLKSYGATLRNILPTCRAMNFLPIAVIACANSEISLVQLQVQETSSNIDTDIANIQFSATGVLNWAMLETQRVHNEMENALVGHPECLNPTVVQPVAPVDQVA